MDMLEGVVTKAAPLEISVTNDDMNILTDDELYVPQHLTDYDVMVSFSGGAKSKMTIYNALKAGDKVHLLAFNRGKQYYVLDRM